MHIGDSISLFKTLKKRERIHRSYFKGRKGVRGASFDAINSLFTR